MTDWPAALSAEFVAAGLAQGRVHWGLRPEKGLLPALVLTAVGGELRHTTEGQPDLRRSRVQADAYAPTHLEAWALIEATLAAAHAPFEKNGVRFASAGHGAPRTLPDKSADGTALFRATVDLNFWHI